MTLNIHDTTPASKTPKWLKGMLYGSFALMCIPYALGAFAVITYAGQIAFGVLLAILPFLFLLLLLWTLKNLARSCIDISKEEVTVIEYPFGRKTVKHIAYEQIDHARLILPGSWKLRGPRIKSVGIPYIVFFDKSGKQLFKILAYPEALQFQQSVTKLQ